MEPLRRVPTPAPTVAASCGPLVATLGFSVRTVKTPAGRFLEPRASASLQIEERPGSDHALPREKAAV